MPNETSHGFTVFRKRIEILIRQELERTKPAYFEIAQRRFAEIGTQGDLQRVADETKSVLGEGLATWVPLLENLVEVELARDKMLRSLQFLHISPRGKGHLAHQGAWIEYHMNQWFFQIYAYLDGMRTLICRCCRKLVKPRKKDWKTIEDPLVKTIEDVKSRLKPLRDALAHGGGAKEPLIPAEVWGLYLLASNQPIEPIDLVQFYYQSVIPYQHSWYSMLQQETDKTLATMEGILDELGKHAF